MIHKRVYYRPDMTQIDDSNLGIGPAAFIAKFKTLALVKQSTYDLKWKGHLHQLPVYKISIQDLRYNLFNTRVKPHLKQYISEHNLEDDYFQQIDKDKHSTQQLIQNFLESNPDRKEALKFFREGNIPVSQLPLVSTIDGRLINGNQRLCCYRELRRKDPGKYDYLQTAYVAFLPDNGSLEDERALEANFQDTELGTSMFDWIQQGLWLIEQIKEGQKTPKEIASTIGKTQTEVKLHINRIFLAKDFLEYIEKPDYWVALRDEMKLDQAFKTLQSEISNHKTQEDKELLKKMAFKIMEDPVAATKGKNTSVHKVIGSISKNLQVTKSQIKKPEPKLKTPKDNDDDIFAPVPTKTEAPVDNHDDVNLIDIEDIDPGDLVDVIIDVAQVEDDKNKAKNEKAYGLKQLKGAVTSLDNILKNWDNIDKKGLKNQVNKALKRLQEIKEKL